MSWLHLIWANLWRKPARTLLTAASLAMAFMLFGLLTPVLMLFENRDDLAGVDRLLIQPRHSITDFLPVGHAAAVAALPGVRAVAHQTWFGGIFRDPANNFPRWAVPPAAFLNIRPELTLTPEQRRAFETTRAGAIVGRAIAQRYGINVGDRIALVPDIWSNRDGTAWEFDIVGVYTTANDQSQDTALYFSYDYFDEYRTWGNGQVSLLTAQLDAGADAADVADRIDQRFANSANETTTSSERAYALGFADQLGNVGLMLSVILTSVLFTIALLAATTMAQSVRERTAELAVLRAFGFQRAALSTLVLTEAFAIALLGAVPGLLCAQLLLNVGQDYLAQLGSVGIDAATLVAALAAAVLLAAVAGVPSALRVHRLSIVDALRDS